MTSEAHQDPVGFFDKIVAAPYADDLQDEGRYGKVSAGGTDGRHKKFWEAVC